MYKIGKKYNGNPQQAKEEYLTIIQQDMERLHTLQEVRRQKKNNRSSSTTTTQHRSSLKEYSAQLCEAIIPSLFEECGCINFCILSTIGELDEQRRNGLSDEIKTDYEALCGGYIGDELMEMNIAMYNLSRTLPESIWMEYTNDDLMMKQLAERIQKNLKEDKKKEEGRTGNYDLPNAFLTSWKEFMTKYGY